LKKCDGVLETNVSLSMSIIPNAQQPLGKLAICLTAKNPIFNGCKQNAHYQEIRKYTKKLLTYLDFSCDGKQDGTQLFSITSLFS